MAGGDDLECFAEVLLGLSGSQASDSAAEDSAADGSMDTSATFKGQKRLRSQPFDRNLGTTAGKRAYTWRGTKTTAASSVIDMSNPREGDREWAALTTWLRMNIHHARTNRKLVPFLGSKHPKSGIWTFSLNPKLTLADLGEDTQSRLAGLIEEAKAAFQRKYPNRPPEEWESKTQRYRPPGSNQYWQVPVGDMVSSLAALVEERGALTLAVSTPPPSEMNQ